MDLGSVTVLEDESDKTGLFFKGMRLKETLSPASS